MLISVLLIEKCAANWNCGGWAIVILFGLNLLKAWTEPSLVLSANLRY